MSLFDKKSPRGGDETGLTTGSGETELTTASGQTGLTTASGGRKPAFDTQPAAACFARRQQMTDNRVKKMYDSAARTYTFIQAAFFLLVFPFISYQIFDMINLPLNGIIAYKFPSQPYGGYLSSARYQPEFLTDYIYRDPLNFQHEHRIRNPNYHAAWGGTPQGSNSSKGAAAYREVKSGTDQFPAIPPQAPTVHRGHGLYHLNWQEVTRTLTPLAWLTVLIAFILTVFARLTRRKYIRVTDDGLITTNSNNMHDLANPTPWSCLKRIEIDNWGPINCRNPKLTLNCDHGQESLRWSDIVSCVEPGTFINALRTYAPAAVAQCRFPTETSLERVDNGSYTQLWFKYYSTGTDRKRAGELQAGDQLNSARYTVMNKLAGGGQGTAYLAVDNACEDHPVIVLKEYILPVHRGQQVLEQSASKLRREAEILRAIDHANIVKIRDEFMEDHRGYLAMEYIEGRTLKELVFQQGRLPETSVQELAMQICSILQYLHGMTPPVVHRDLAPDNLILQEDGIVKLVDFNVAHQLESAATATVVGKHAYIPPEQFRGKPTAQSDIYAFGCTMHYLLTGEDPEPLTVSHPRLTNEHVSEELDSLVASCTALDATKRYADIAQVREALESIKSDNSSGHKIKVPKSSFSNA